MPILAHDMLFELSNNKLHIPELELLSLVHMESHRSWGRQLIRRNFCTIDFHIYVLFSLEIVDDLVVFHLWPSSMVEQIIQTGMRK